MKVLFDYRLRSGGIGVYSRYIIRMLNEFYGSTNVTLLVNESVDNKTNPILITKVHPYSFRNFFLIKNKENFDCYFAPSYLFFNVSVRKRFMVVHDLAVLLDKNYFNGSIIRAVGLVRWKFYFFLLNLMRYRIYGISDTTSKDIERCWRVPVLGVLENVVSVNIDYLSDLKDNPFSSSVFYFGNSRKHKNIERIFKLAEKYPHVQFKFSGACCDDHRLNWNLLNVQRLGFLDEKSLSSELSNVDASILLSTYEGFGRGVVESLLHGTPAIINRGGALKELYDNGIISLDRDEDFKIALARAKFIKNHKLINLEYWQNKHSYERIKMKLKEALV